MWPWGHAAFGYLFYVVYCHLRDSDRPSLRAGLWLLLGTQFPDLVDKPLAFLFPTLGGRAPIHSLLVGVPLLAALWQRSPDRDGWQAACLTAFSVGYLSHPLADAVLWWVIGNVENTTFLLWPLLPPHFEDPPLVLAGGAVVIPGWIPSPIEFPTSRWYLVDIALVLVALVVWVAEEGPGARVARE